MPDSTKSQQPKLLDQVRQVLRLHHYSIHTERSYVDWIVRFVRFHSMRSREHLFPAGLCENGDVDEIYESNLLTPFFELP